MLNRRLKIYASHPYTQLFIVPVYLCRNQFIITDILFVAFSLEEWEVPREKVKLSDVIGRGSFGMVYRGSMCDAVSGEPELPVAIKVGVLSVR